MSQELTDESKRLLISIAMNDKTPEYEYPYGRYAGLRVKTFNGTRPKSGQRFLTPKEIARNMLGSEYSQLWEEECERRELKKEEK